MIISTSHEIDWLVSDHNFKLQVYYSRDWNMYSTGVRKNKMIDKKSLKIPMGGNQNLYIKEEQTTQWPKEKVQRDKQRSTKHTYKLKIE
jgi:hypothetical protein